MENPFQFGAGVSPSPCSPSQILVFSEQGNHELACIPMESGEFSKSAEEVLMITCSLLDRPDMFPDLNPSKVCLKEKDGMELAAQATIPRNAIVYLCSKRTTPSALHSDIKNNIVIVDFGNRLVSLPLSPGECITQLEAIQKACHLILYDPNEWSTTNPDILCALNVTIEAHRKEERSVPNVYAMQLVEEFVQLSPANTTRMNQKFVANTTQYAIVMLVTGEREENVRQRHCAMLGLDWTQYRIEDSTGCPVDMVYPQQDYYLKIKKDFL